TLHVHHDDAMVLFGFVTPNLLHREVTVQHGHQREAEANRKDREETARAVSRGVPPYVLQKFHRAAPSGACSTLGWPLTSTPFSRCSRRLARAAAFGSCVTMTIVFS